MCMETENSSGITGMEFMQIWHIAQAFFMDAFDAPV